MKFVLISPKNRTTYNFRGDLLQTLIDKGYDVIVTGPNEENMDKIQELGVSFRLVPLDKTGLSVFGDLKYLLELVRLFKKEKPDVTLGYTIKPVIYGSIAAKIAGVENINSMVTGAGYVFTAETGKAKIIRLVVSMLYRVAFRCADTVIFQNSDDLSEFVNRGLVSREKCKVVNGSGVNMAKFKPVKYPENLTFFMLSRVMYSKGVREYLQAARRVKALYPEVRFILLGALENIQDSLSMDELEPYISANVIEYFGETDNVADYYRRCSVYVLPSYREGTPRTVLEAMAMGRPIITTDAPGCRETVIDGYNGFLVPVQNSDALAEKMIWFIKNQDKISTMGRASFELCRERFDVRKVNKVMLQHMKMD